MFWRSHVTASELKEEGRMRSAVPLLLCALSTASAFAPALVKPTAFTAPRGLALAPRSLTLAPSAALRPARLGQLSMSAGGDAAEGNTKRQQLLAKLAVLTAAATIACSGGATASALRGKAQAAATGARIENVRQCTDLVAHGGGGQVLPLHPAQGGFGAAPKHALPHLEACRHALFGHPTRAMLRGG